ncbi:outer membrane beta-barrel protein [Flavobacterium sp. MC2016-06]|uniref:outer membrane beta-barrel protein n=1 Tax=Flavobacterium sp. MC2016-06 TaxID=2676308 RepID=UPI0012BAE7B9|nr:outer membrane beta-barrel protein [Flavobacterium sp. MC2016-06]MBU3857569.1 TonB-dependent receptor [Flavobacterium sp. MC2016-06]
MRRSILLFVLFLSVISTAQTGKGTLSGKVLDSEAKVPIEMAIVSIFKDGETKPFNGLTTDHNGSFSFSGLADGSYRITIDFISYKVVNRQNIIISSVTDKVNLGEILLLPAANELSEVTVTSKAATVQNKIDKMVYNPVNDLSSQGGVATDVLKNVPLVSIDIDGNVELQGNSNIRFLINGKPSSIFGASVSDALQSIPASQIKNIEVITSPGAKYDASGTGGIINIVLKDNKVEGINGSANLSLGTRLENGGFTLNAKKGNFGAGIYFSGNKQLNTKTLTNNERLSYNTAKDSLNSISQQGVSPFTRKGYQTGINLNWSISPKDEITGTLGYNYFDNNATAAVFQNQQSYLSNGTILSDVNSQRNSMTKFKNNAIDYSVAYKKKFDKEGQELNVLYTSSSGKSLNRTSQETLDLSDNSLSGNQTNNPGKDHEQNVSVDFTTPISEGFVLETGSKLTTENISSQVASDTLSDTGMYVPNIGQSYNFNYKRNIYAGYLSSSFALFDGFLDGRIGLRYERTNTSADFAGVSIPDYNTFAPSFTIQHKLSEKESVKFTYSYRIERPDYNDLNPFYNISDPHNISTGNPFLKPEIGNRYEISYNKSYDNGANLFLSGYYRYNTDDIQTFSTFHKKLTIEQTVYTDVTLTERYNIGSQTNIGLSIFGLMPFTKSFTAKGTFDFGERTNTTPGYKSVSGFAYRANMNLTYKFGSDFMAELVGNYRSMQKNLQGNRPGSFFYNLSVRKQFLNKNASVGIVMANPFNKYLNQRSTNYGATFEQVNIKDVPVQSFGIALSYKFGKLEFKKGETENHDASPQPEI